MRYLSNRALDLIDAAADAPSAAEVGRRFFAALRPYGVRAIYARRHRSADGADVTAYSRISRRRAGRRSTPSASCTTTS